MKLSEKILNLRKKFGLSQEELANELDISRQAVYKWEADISSPDLDKLKQLAKLFNISFDYLMNDDIENTAVPVEPYKYTPRSVFNTELNVDFHHADIDNGFSKTRKASNKKVLETLQLRKSKAVAHLKSVGATEIVFIQPNATIAFFYDENKKVCGFYHTGEIQFVCPIENVLDFSFGGGNSSVVNTTAKTLVSGFGSFNTLGVGTIPVATAIRGTSAHAVLYYTDDGTNVKNFKLNFNIKNICNLSYLEVLKHPMNSGSLEAYEANLMQQLTKTLVELKGKIDAFKQISARITTGELSIDSIDVFTYQNSNIKAKKEYEEYLLSITEEAKKANTIDSIKSVFIVGGYILFIALQILFS